MDSVQPNDLAEHDGAAEEEVLFQDDRTLIVRRRLSDGRCVVDKQAFGAEAQARLRHEADVLARLADVEGVPRVLTDEAPPGILRLDDEGGRTLYQTMRQGRLPLRTVVDIAIGLADVLAAVHAAGVIHKDVNPSNILLRGAQQRPTLIDFNIASRYAEERPGFIHHSHIVGTLAYMSPEQTGRTGRSADQRSDLYALGVTLYEMLVGRKPFESEDLLELIHAHLVDTPVPPHVLDKDVPPVLSAIVMKLQEKEAGRRYQSAAGLAHDLRRLRDALAAGEEGAMFELGRDDFPLRLTPPQRLIGRDAEVRSLGAALDKAISGENRALLLAGAPGVGKSALIAELQPIVTSRHGWFVSGKFDQYQHEGTSAIVQALRALGRLLLAEPEDELARHRRNIARALGANLGYGASLLPEYAMLLGDGMPRVTVADPREAETRVVQSCIDLLHGIVSPEQPVVMVIDDLQWAPPLSLRLIDALLTDTRSIPGLLLVGAYRHDEVDAAHPLAAMLARWEQLGAAPPMMTLANLPPEDTGRLVGEMLRLDADSAASLGATIATRTGGNPYDTVELINALRHDGLLVVRDGGWHWEDAAIQRYVGDCDVVGLLNKRISQLPQPSIALLETLAMLGGEAQLSLLGTATGQDDSAVQEQLVPALDDGLLVTDNAGDRQIRFRHDRVQQAMFERMADADQGPSRLALARRLAASPEHAHLAAQQYLGAVAQLDDAVERKTVISLLRRAAAKNRVINYVAAERFLSAAIVLVEKDARAVDETLLRNLLTERHAALYGLTRLDEADAVYDALARLCPDPCDLADAACVQIATLCARQRHQEGMALGLTLLGRLGLQTPEDIRAAIAMGLMRLSGWIAGTDKDGDLQRPEPTDRQVVALSKVLSKTQVAAFFCNAKMGSWLTMESHRMWVEHGPNAFLASTLCSTPMQLIAILEDHKGAHVTARHLLKVCEARGYQPATAIARLLYVLAAAHWFEPLELSPQQYRQAREELVQSGDLQYAVLTFSSWPTVLDCAPSLEACVDEIEAGFAMTARTGDANFHAMHLPSRQLMKVLRGEMPAGSPPGSFAEPGFSERDHEMGDAKPSLGHAYYHLERALSAALFNDTPELIRHASLSLQLMSRTPGQYINLWAHLLCCIALSERLRRSSTEDEQPALLKAFDASLNWVKKRTADAPGNYLHIQRWLEAERAWATGDTWGALTSFNAAMDEAQRRTRPWHRAMLTERAALFHLSQGLDHTGRPLLTEACALYRAWGARGKVQQLLADHGFLRTAGIATASSRSQGARTHSTMVAGDIVDVASVLRASQALSSETSLEKLTACVGKVLGALTGAATVLLAVRSDDQRDWLISRAAEEGGVPCPLDEAVERRMLALGPFRYAERTREPVLINEATRDDRFARDPYFEGIEHCSLLLVPVLSHGELRAVLVLENRLSRGAFSADRLDTVTMIAGQLAVSLDNALLYASLERKVAERTAALEEANRRLELISTTDALTGVANRRRFNDALDIEWERAKRTHTPIGLVLIDIDQFKLYNDHYGHQGGDACLKLVAEAMASGLRAGGDLLARYGGEEFVLLLPNTDLAGASVVAERVRAAVESRQEPHAAAKHGIVTISAGIASFVPPADFTPSHFIDVADAALYRAKEGGRNRVCAAGSP